MVNPSKPSTTISNKGKKVRENNIGARGTSCYRIDSLSTALLGVVLEVTEPSQIDLLVPKYSGVTLVVPGTACSEQEAFAYSSQSLNMAGVLKERDT